MPTVALLINETKPAALEAARQLTAFLNERGIPTRARELVALQIDEALANTSLGCAGVTDDELAQADFAVVFGGDGTLLGAARLLAPHGTPLLGVHLGRFGFMTEVPLDELESAVGRVLDNDYTVEKRLMLSGEIQRGTSAPDEEPIPTLLAMNDMVVAGRAVRMVHVETRVGSEMLATYAADGVIVASPTGSTGYSLSCGGPLVHPAAPVLLVTPISPHTLSARTLLVPDTETVVLTLDGSTRDAATVAVDGQIEIPLYPGDTLRVTRAGCVARFISVGGPSFYEKIRTRWGYGERLSA